MNLLDAYVTIPLSLPYQKYNKWCVMVEYICWSDAPCTTELFFNSEEEALKCQEGYHFLC
jgi:hypothetical protein